MHIRHLKIDSKLHNSDYMLKSYHCIKNICRDYTAVIQNLNLFPEKWHCDIKFYGGSFFKVFRAMRKIKKYLKSRYIKYKVVKMD